MGVFHEEVDENGGVAKDTIFSLVRLFRCCLAARGAQSPDELHLVERTWSPVAVLHPSCATSVIRVPPRSPCSPTRCYMTSNHDKSLSDKRNFEVSTPPVLLEAGPL